MATLDQMPSSFKALLCFLLVIAGALPSARAVEKLVGATVSYNTTAPTGVDITNWSTGWPTGGVTGWDYVGIVAGGGGAASGVYLGNNWVLTAAHVGAGTFTLGGISYTAVGPGQGLPSSTADVWLFQISSAPPLLAMPIAASPPTPFSLLDAGSSVAMIGFGDGGAVTNKTWGLNTVTQTSQNVHLTDTPYTTTDFETDYGTTTFGISSVTNNYLLSLGDSGGGDFIYNSSTSKWELAGINEAVDGSNNSYMVQLSSYRTQINAIIATPEPSVATLLGLGVLGLWGRRRGLGRR